MKELNLSDAIRERRKELGLSQSKLCEGLCSVTTLSRMENGTQTLSYNILTAILQRLGMPENRYYALLSENEEELEMRRRELQACKVQLQRASKGERPHIWRQTMEALQALEKITEEDGHITRQYILITKSTLGREDGPYSLDEERSMLMEAIRLTIPHFRIGPYETL